MNKKLLSIIIANAVMASSFTQANEVNTIMSLDSSDSKNENIEEVIVNDNLMISQENSLYKEILSANGTVGSAFEFEEKTTDKSNGNYSKEQIHTNTIVTLNLSHSLLRGALFGYDLKKMHRRKKDYLANGSTDGQYYETEDGYTHIFRADKGFSLGNGFGTGLFYGAEFGKSYINSQFVNDHDQSSIEHTVKPSFTYWNPNYGLGFYSHFELLITEFDQGSWGVQDDTAYSYLFKPYYRKGNWEIGLELFYQHKDTERTSGGTKQISEFEEFYIEPIITYSFEDAGVLYARARFGENETRNKTGFSGDMANAEYYTDILKGTIGYEQVVGEDWIVKAEYEFTHDDKDHNLNPTTHLYEEVKGHKVYLQALYRF